MNADKVKRIGCAVLIILVILTIIYAAVPTIHWGLVGFIHGDPFCKGRPASYWKVEIQRSPDDISYELQRGGKEAVPILISILQDKSIDTVYRAYAAVALGDIGPVAEDAIPSLEIAAQEDDKYLRWRCRQALESIAVSNRKE